MIVAPIRVVQGAPVTVTFTSVDSNGEPSAVDPGSVTVGVDSADGTTVVAAGTATTGSGASRSFTLTAAHTALLDSLTVTWTASATTVGTTTVDVVGNVLATLADVRNTEASLNDPNIDSVEDLLRARAEVEAMFERACGHVLSFVPRFSVATLYHRGQRMLRVPHYYLRRIRWARYWDGSDTDPTDVEPALLAGIQPNEAGIALLYDATESWPIGRIQLGYEHGLDGPPADVKRQAIHAIRRQANQARSGVDSRAMSYQTATGEVVRMPTPGLGPWVTGVPEIDELLRWYRDRYPTASMA